MASEIADDVDQIVNDSEAESSEDDAPPPPKKMMMMGGGDESGEADGGGKGMGAVKPYVGAIVAPSSGPENNPAPPEQGLTLDWAYGFRAFDSKSNLVTNTRGHVVYPVAALIVVYNRAKEVQSFYRGHDDDVRCLAQNPADKDWMVTGQNATIVNGRATAPHACVWNSTDFTQSFKLQLPAGARAVRSVAFSPDGKYVSVVANDDNHTISIWDWRAKKQLASQNGDKNPIFQVRWNHVLNAPGVYEIVTVGTKHAFFHVYDSHAHALKSKRVTLGGSYPIQTWNTVTFSEKGHTCLGGFDGTILICKQGTNGVASKAIHASAAALTPKAPKLFSLDTYAGGIVAGASDRTVIVFNSKLVIDRVFTFDHKVTAVHVRGQDLFVGTQGSEVFEIKSFLEVATGPVAGRFEPLTSGHVGGGELWAIAPCADGKRAISAGEDNQVILWDLKTHRAIKRGVINPKAGPAPKVQKASTTSTYPQNQCARAVAISPDGRHIAVGTNDGHLTLFDEGLTVISTTNLNSHSKRKVTDQEGNWIQTIQFSPSGRTLAVGTHGSVVCLLDVADGYKVKGTLAKSSSAITSMDWAEDGSFLRTNDLGYELLFYSVDEDALANSKQVTSATSMRDVAWATTNCPLSYSALGVVEGNDGSFINSVAHCPSTRLLATADDDGRVSLYRFPVIEVGNAHYSYKGHSSHVTSVRFTPDSTTLLSTGGHDSAIFQWRVDQQYTGADDTTHTLEA